VLIAKKVLYLGWVRLYRGADDEMVRPVTLGVTHAGFRPTSKSEVFVVGRVNVPIRVFSVMDEQIQVDSTYIDPHLFPFRVPVTEETGRKENQSRTRASLPTKSWGMRLAGAFDGPPCAAWAVTNLASLVGIMLHPQLEVGIWVVPDVLEIVV
jgi:hypothetical protein